jgi:hypothetical protein
MNKLTGIVLFIVLLVPYRAESALRMHFIEALLATR